MIPGLVVLLKDMTGRVDVGTGMHVELHLGFVGDGAIGDARELLDSVLETIVGHKEGETRAIGVRNIDDSFGRDRGRRDLADA